jgi:AcrR family transcriptional regulator
MTPRPKAEPPAPPEGDLRDRLLTIAGQLLQKHGPDKFSIRELAREGAISTMGIYTVFGGRAGVMQALYAEGFAKQHAYAASAINRADPRAWLIGELHAYRNFALQNVGLYRLMFGGEKRFTPAGRSREFQSLVVPDAGAYPVYSVLVDAIAACLALAPSASRRSADELAHVVWGTLHGLVGLEIAGYVDGPAAEARFKTGVDCILELVGAA